MKISVQELDREKVWRQQGLGRAKVADDQKPIKRLDLAQTENVERWVNAGFAKAFEQEALAWGVRHRV